MKRHRFRASRSSFGKKRPAKNAFRKTMVSSAVETMPPSAVTEAM